MQVDNRPNSGVSTDLFTEIEQRLKDICGDTYHSNFSELVRKSRSINPVIQQYANDHRNYSQLRNAIIHKQRENFVIAVPQNDFIKEIKHIRNLIYNPPRDSKVMKVTPFAITPKTPIIEMLETLANEGFIGYPIINGSINVQLSTIN